MTYESVEFFTGELAPNVGIHQIVLHVAQSGRHGVVTDTQRVQMFLFRFGQKTQQVLHEGSFIELRCGRIHRAHLMR